MTRRGFWTAFTILAAVIITLAGLNLGLKEPETWDESHDIANARISWSQTFHGGTWD